MRQILIRMLALVFFAFCSSTAFAGMFLCNETSQSQNVAIGYQQDGHWLSQGWFIFEPRECDSLLLGVPQNTSFYIYARGNDGRVGWSGDGHSDAGFFCMEEDKKFFYNSDSNDCRGKNFRKIDITGYDQYTITLAEESDPTRAALSCQAYTAQGINAFAGCWMRNMATQRQLDILDCWNKDKDPASFALCAGKSDLNPKAYAIATCANNFNNDKVTAKFLECVSDSQLNQSESKLVDCAIENRSNYTATLSCAALSSLNPEQQRLIACVANNPNSYVAEGLCVAGNRISPEQSRIAGCVMNNRGSYTQMGVCAVGNKLTPEQQVFVSCAISTGGQPYAYAGCVGTQLTMNELQKCLTQGIGGNGCYGPNNTAVKVVTNAFKDITQGPGPSNDLLGRDGWVGRTAQNVGNDLTHGPGDTNDVVGRHGWLRSRLGF
jgi:uncharacterized membrane protein